MIISETIIEIPARKVAIIEPSEAAKNDPPLSEWLALPMGDSCPHCCEKHWGTDNPIGYLLVRKCKECGGRFREYPNLYTLKSLADAIGNVPKRLGR